MRRVVLAGILGFGMIAGAIGFAAPDNAAADWWNNGWLDERASRDGDPDGPDFTGQAPSPEKIETEQIPIGTDSTASFLLEIVTAYIEVLGI